MRYHYGSEKQGRKGHLAMVKEKRLVYRFGELALNWRQSEVTRRSAAGGSDARATARGKPYRRRYPQ